jgi:hypothetical protein
MAITQAIANSFKKQLLEGDHDFRQSGGDKFKLSLYTAGATLTSATTSYTTSNEVSPSGQYSAGGGALVNAGTSITAGVARADFDNLSFTGVTLTARGALIYNTSLSNAAVAVLDFGSDKTATSGTFTIQFPAPTSTAAILRISG